MIRKLGVRDAEAFCELRRQSLLEAPLAFASSPEDDFASDPETVREQLGQASDSVIFGAFDGHLVGVVGLYRDRHRKSSHKVHLWGMYVTPDHRRQGIGTRVLRAGLEHAENMPGVSRVHLSVSSTVPGALRLYESAGFRPWGTEPDALRYDGQIASVIHMELDLGFLTG